MVAEKFFTNASYIVPIVSNGCFTISRIIPGISAISSSTHLKTFFALEFFEISLSIQKTQ